MYIKIAHELFHRTFIAACGAASLARAAAGAHSRLFIAVRSLLTWAAQCELPPSKNKTKSKKEILIEKMNLIVICVLLFGSSFGTAINAASLNGTATWADCSTTPGYATESLKIDPVDIKKRKGRQRRLPA